ncbi:4'-phosphopantetheinyl transferase family protein [Ewingella americana]|uniref:Enterobactin synthase component D n=1 Tax=Ewingella americana TaxID=41202 RepID=A0A502GLI6_9GAMM|nr:4'-phosphopantetheinyl transferase superfamily protein [Ewingella americana]TPG63167.1 4'-phosphopantetheinyl transferase superfamily protein [Ewingella americana]
MPDHFITAVSWLNLPQAAGFTGKIARCQFALSAYHDGLFAELGVVFPSSLTRAVPKRRAEFLAGRYLASVVLPSLGYPQFTVDIGDDRAPRWPEQVRGAISHNANTVLCAAQICGTLPFTGGVGIDVETLMDGQQALELLPMIVNGAEYELLRCHPNLSLSALLTLTFSAKESLFKMLYPQVGRLFGFLDAQLVALDEQAGRFTLELTTGLGAELRAGMRFEGVYRLSRQDVITFLYC